MNVDYLSRKRPTFELICIILCRPWIIFKMRRPSLFNPVKRGTGVRPLSNAKRGSTTIKVGEQFFSIQSEGVRGRRFAITFQARGGGDIPLLFCKLSEIGGEGGGWGGELESTDEKELGQFGALSG